MSTDITMHETLGIYCTGKWVRVVATVKYWVLGNTNLIVSMWYWKPGSTRSIISLETLYFVDCESADWRREIFLDSNERYIPKL